MHLTEAKGILTARASVCGMNIYRGCTHGCIYCDARSVCYQMKHRFEDVEVKINAPDLLRLALSKKRCRCMIGTGAMSDPYVHCEAQFGLTRKCLEIADEYGFGMAVHTKSDLVLRDLDLLRKINEHTKCVVQMTLTTYDERLCKLIEPNVCTTEKRFRTLDILRENGIPTVVWISPILPFINDTEENLRGLLDYCFRAGVKGIVCFGMGVTLREGDREYFYENLDRHFPGIKQKYIKRYGSAYECSSDNNAALMKIFESECKSHGVMYDPWEIFDYMNRFEEKSPEQLSLF